ncbi:DoxX family protein [Rhodohalobacter halophilus]|uniref:DoxX family protein n=1 Tax=Rhodohalobacter halophilus TaxID=1812810 RepID=UPI00083FC0AD|nr:MauE/DoxX family redox-associated membrane protein [Rhodohalobacter halophilus]
MTSHTDSIISTDRQMGFALLRVLLGFNMLGRSLVRIPEINDFASGMAESFAETILPGSFVFIYAFVIVIAEFVIGSLLILGWKTRWALALMGMLMLTLTFGQVLQQNFGTLANILIYGIGVSFLLFNTRYDHFGIDRGFSVEKGE